MEQRFTPLAHRFCLWMGPVMTVIYIPGWLWLAKFWPVPTPDWPAARLAAWLADHRTAYELGCVLMVIPGGLFVPWAASLAVWTRKTEARFPVLYITQIVALAAGACIFIPIALFWALAGFRAGETDPAVTQAFFDTGWFMFLFDIPMFIVWVAGLALGILWNPPEHQLLPRWAGYITLASCVCWSPGLVIPFFKDGPFAYNGLLAMWLPITEFFVWLVAMTVAGFKAISIQEALCRQETEPGYGVYAPSWDDDDDRDPVAPTSVWGHRWPRPAVPAASRS